LRVATFYELTGILGHNPSTFGIYDSLGILRSGGGILLGGVRPIFSDFGIVSGSYGNPLNFFRLALNCFESFQGDDSSPYSGKEQRPVRPRFWRESRFKNALRFLLGALLLFSPVPWWR
jgi:hypothetical protein